MQERIARDCFHNGLVIVQRTQGALKIRAQESMVCDFKTR